MAEHPLFPKLPVGMQIASSTGMRFEWQESGKWKRMSEDGDPFAPVAGRFYRIDFDPSEKLSIEHDGHVYTEGDWVAFTSGYGTTFTRLEARGKRLVSTNSWGDRDGWCPYLIEPNGHLCGGIEYIEPLADWEVELLKGDDEPEAVEPNLSLHTIDCHGIDPAIIQDLITTWVTEHRAARKRDVARDELNEAQGAAAAARNALRDAIAGVVK